jgi:hypothetical protein
MEMLIALLALVLLIVPMLAGIRRMRRLPPPDRNYGPQRVRGSVRKPRKKGR